MSAGRRGIAFVLASLSLFWLNAVEAQADTCTSLTVIEPVGGDKSGADVVEHEVPELSDSLGTNNSWLGGQGDIRAPGLSRSVHTRIIRSFVMLADDISQDYMEWGWLRDPGSGNIEFFWARKLAGVYRDKRSDVYTYSSRRAKIQSRGPTWLDTRIWWQLYVGTSYKGEVEHQFNRGRMYTLAERWNACDPNEAKFSNLQYRDLVGTYRGWREMHPGTGEPGTNNHDPSYVCEKGVADNEWWTVKVDPNELDFDCFPDTDPL